MTNAIPSEPEQCPPVRGWLLVLCLTMTVIPAVLIGLMIIAGATMASPAGTVLLIVGAIMLTFSAPAMVIGTLLWMRKRAGLIAAKVYFVASLILGAVGWLSLATLPHVDMVKATTELVVGAAICGLWFTYLNSSTRVRATFAPPRGQRPPMGAKMQAAPQTNPVLWEREVAARGRIQPSASTSDDEIYEIIANEIDAGNISKGLWTRLFVQAEGDENKTKVLYIKHRSAELLAVRDKRVAQEAVDAARPGQDNSNGTSSLDLDVATEKRLIDALRSRALNASEIKVITKWVTRTMRPGLQRIANTRGLTLDVRSGLGGGVLYRFYNG